MYGCLPMVRGILAIALVAASTCLPVVSGAAEPYQLTLRRTEAVLEIEGAVPDGSARSMLVAAASGNFPGLPVKVALVERPGAPQGLVEVATRAMELLSRTAVGEARIVDRTVEFSGSAYHPKAFAELESLLGQDWPDGYTAVGNGLTSGPADPSSTAAECERELRAIAGIEPVEFEVGQADIRAVSRRLLDRVAFAVSRCPDAFVAVAGHTDSDGASEANFQLSIERARAVVDLLVADGLEPARFTALGYGESRPLASNATDAGKARNRRIEFVFKD